MRWSLPPSRYYAEDRLSFGELSWKTLRSLVSIWVKTLSIFIAGIVVGRLFTVKFTRPKLIEFLATCPATTIAMEACGGSHFMARKLEELGHFPKLISPQFVRPFVKSNKNDFVDAEAICEAASRPSMRVLCSPEPESQQAMRALHRVRESLVQDKVKTTNQMHAFLLEFGISVPRGAAVISRLSTILEDNSLPLYLSQLLLKLQQALSLSC